MVPAIFMVAFDMEKAPIMFESCCPPINDHFATPEAVSHLTLNSCVSMTGLNVLLLSQVCMSFVKYLFPPIRAINLKL